ncbi:ATP-binding protein [Herbaspirillum sp. SJZ107]|uniref:ATP-binding protein n=1 Tax=Herbaspirillum sp. SJZ107 TaxID=2572881 RepID=UPI0011547D5F|nr:ATP-binding protein [Herbaspirillum sp. SJZ107]TQK08072.1 PAS domain S-box-containing protein [Herbaspirillum sp. SJZ107]
MPTVPTFFHRLLPRALGAWMALAFALLSIVFTLVLSAVIERKATEQVKSGIGYGLADRAAQTSDKLERGMFERYREVGLIARRHDLGADVPLARRRETLERVQASYGYYSWIGLAGIDGRVQVAARGMLEGADVSRRPWFDDALKGDHVGDVHDAVLLAKLLPHQAEPWRFVDVAFPYLDERGNTVGVLGAHLSWQWARDVERSVMAGVGARSNVEALIVDAAGSVLLGPPDSAGRKLSLPSLELARSQLGNGYVVERWPDGKSYLVGYARGHGYADYPGLGWTVLVRQEVLDAYGPVRRLREYGLIAGVLLAALFSLAGVLVARRITQPLGELAESARRIRAGEPVKLGAEHGRYVEVQALSGTLDALVADLMQQRKELKELNATLEQRVEQRTRELEQALVTVSAGKQRIDTILGTVQDAFVAIDLQGRVVDWNAAAEAMLGWRRDEVLGRLAVELMVPAHLRANALDALQRFRDTGELEIQGRRVERVLCRRDGSEVEVEMTAAIAGTPEGPFFSIFAHDISGRKQVERMKNEFVSTVSHELRTPLTSISASLALLADGMAGELPADAQGLVGIANASSERLVRLIGDVLDIQKMDAGRMESSREVQPVLPVAEGAVAAMAGLAAQAGVTLACEAGPGAAALRAGIDRDRITQVLANLLSNAVKFSEAGTTVTTRVEDGGGCVRLSVTDQGSGIPEAFRDRVFQRFAQADGTNSRRSGGTGLGLSICKAIVEQHGGTIRFDSVAGQGTTFVVELPAA